MPKLYLPVDDVEAALADAVEKADAKAYQRGRDDAARIIELASKLNGSTHAVLKAIRGEDDAGRDSVDAAVRPDVDARGGVSGAVRPVAVDGVGGSGTEETAASGDSGGTPESVTPEDVMLALLDVVAEAKLHHPDSDGGPVAAVLVAMLDDPQEANDALLLKAVLTDTVASLLHAATEALKTVQTGPDYQRLYWNPSTKTAWWVSADGDEEADVQAIKAALAAVPGVESVRAEAEYAPKETGWHLLLKAFREDLHPRDDNGRFVSREAIHAAKNDPAKAEQLREKVTDPEQRAKLDAALAAEADLGRTKAGLHREKVAAAKAAKEQTINRARELANDISTARRGGEPVPPEHFQELATLLPSLSVQELRSVRGKLAASFWTRTKREDMVTALVRHAKVKAEQLAAENAADDPLDFGMDAMSGRGGTGHADAGRSELNPWREHDKPKRFSEAQHGGRIEQRQALMQEHPNTEKTSHGTPDTGSELKLAPKPSEPIPQDVDAELRKMAKHHRRMGREPGRMIVYQSDSGPVAVTADSYMGQALREGKYPGLERLGEYEYAPDGTPRRINKAVADEWDSLKTELFRNPKVNHDDGATA